MDLSRGLLLALLLVAFIAVFVDAENKYKRGMKCMPGRTVIRFGKEDHWNDIDYDDDEYNFSIKDHQLRSTKDDTAKYNAIHRNKISNGDQYNQGSINPSFYERKFKSYKFGKNLKKTTVKKKCHHKKRTKYQKKKIKTKKGKKGDIQYLNENENAIQNEDEEKESDLLEYENSVVFDDEDEYPIENENLYPNPYSVENQHEPVIPMGYNRYPSYPAGHNNMYIVNNQNLNLNVKVNTKGLPRENTEKSKNKNVDKNNKPNKHDDKNRSGKKNSNQNNKNKNNKGPKHTNKQNTYKQNTYNKNKYKNNYYSSLKNFKNRGRYPSHKKKRFFLRNNFRKGRQETNCYFCVCSTNGEYEYCSKRLVKNINECIESKLMPTIKQTHTFPAEVDERILNPTISKHTIVGKGLEDIKCIPFASEYTDCTRENLCSGCTKCGCLSSGVWSCQEVHVCNDLEAPEQETLTNSDLDNALSLLQNVFEKNNEQPRSPYGYIVAIQKH